jgi:hypothetical protein
MHVCVCMYVRTYVFMHACMNECMYYCMYVLRLDPSRLFRSVKLFKTVEDKVVAYSKVLVCIFTRNLSTAGNEHTLQQLAGVSSRSGSVISHQNAHSTL